MEALDLYSKVKYRGSSSKRKDCPKDTCCLEDDVANPEVSKLKATSDHVATSGDQPVGALVRRRGRRRAIKVDYQFQVGDLVWGKITSYPWWPGIIYDEALASAEVMSSKQEGCVVVYLYGDCTHGWISPGRLLPFEEHFAAKFGPTDNMVLQRAVEEALVEVKRRSILGLSCRCLNKSSFRCTNPGEVEELLEVDFNDLVGTGVYSAKQIEKARDDLQPGEMLDFLQQLAGNPRKGCPESADTIAFISNTSRLVFYRKCAKNLHLNSKDLVSPPPGPVDYEGWNPTAQLAMVGSEGSNPIDPTAPKNFEALGLVSPPPVLINSEGWNPTAQELAAVGSEESSPINRSGPKNFEDETVGLVEAEGPEKSPLGLRWGRSSHRTRKQPKTPNPSEDPSPNPIISSSNELQMAATESSHSVEKQNDALQLVTVGGSSTDQLLKSSTEKAVCNEVQVVTGTKDARGDSSSSSKTMNKDQEMETGRKDVAERGDSSSSSKTVKDQEMKNRASSARRNDPEREEMLLKFMKRCDGILETLRQLK